MVIMLLFVINAVFRGAGDAAIAMRVLIVANLLNMALDPLLIFGWGPIPAMGIEGAAIATNIGRSVVCCCSCGCCSKAVSISASARRNCGESRSRAEYSAHIAGRHRPDAGGDDGVIFLMRILASVSNEAVAGATIALRIMMFTLMPALGPVERGGHSVGQNLGAGQPERAESSVWKIGFYNMAFMIFVSVIFSSGTIR